MNSKVLAIVAVSVMIFASAAMGLSVRDTNNDDIEGHWYQIDYYGYRNGEYTSTGDGNDPSVFDIDVESCKDGLFYGKYLNTDVFGTYNNGIMIFYGKYSGIKTFHHAVVDGDVMYVSVIEQKDDGNVNVFMNTYSKNKDVRSYDIPSAPNMESEWKAYNMEFMSVNGDMTGLMGKTIVINEQRNHIFKGTMEQTVDNGVIPLDMYGILTTVTNGGYSVGYAVVAGEIWSVITDGKVLKLRTTMADTSGLNGSLVTVDRSYSLDGNPAEETFYELENKVWTCADITSVAEKSITVSKNDITLKVSEQNGALFLAEMSYDGASHSAIGYLYGNYFDIAISENGTYVHGSGYIDGNGSVQFDRWYQNGASSCVLTQS